MFTYNRCHLCNYVDDIFQSIGEWMFRYNRCHVCNYVDVKKNQSTGEWILTNNRYHLHNYVDDNFQSMDEWMFMYNRRLSQWYIQGRRMDIHIQHMSKKYIQDDQSKNNYDNKDAETYIKRVADSPKERQKSNQL